MTESINSNNEVAASPSTQPEWVEIYIRDTTDWYDERMGALTRRNLLQGDPFAENPHERLAPAMAAFLAKRERDYLALSEHGRLNALRQNSDKS